MVSVKSAVINTGNPTALRKGYYTGAAVCDVVFGPCTELQAFALSRLADRREFFRETGMKREYDEQVKGYFTFEWVCRDPACAEEGHLHRKRISAQTLERARLKARAISIPENARIIEEEEQMLKMLIVW
jgi:hypothetical protein